ncbi:hypothetical protein BASA81_003569 [Batrachochytrium salamandrivorans]|nr:hypothetical protein BASA81_003569 [Batrachochytrium salamandrivorans]
MWFLWVLVALLLGGGGRATVEGPESITTQPTLVPSVSPITPSTLAPMEAFTAAPTNQPTTQPTDQPSDQPTEQPTNRPTTQPTKPPTKTPTSTPTAQPTTASPTASPTPAPQLNVLLLIADDFKPVLKTYQASAVTGVKMANLDQFSRDGIAFRNAHCQMAICGPSRASFLTSLRPDTLRIYTLASNALDTFVRKSKQTKEALVLPKLFKRSGYLTYGVGKVFHEAEHNLMSDTSVWTEPMYTSVQGLARPRAFTKPYVGAWISDPQVADDFFSDGQAARLSAGLITDVLGKAPPPDTSPMPWFLAVGLWKPHLPWACPAQYFDLAGSPSDYTPTHDLTVSGLSNAQQDLAYGKGCDEVRLYTGASFVLGQGTTSANNMAKANHAYHATALYMDAQMGIVLDALNRSHSRSDTVVVFLGDHGFHLGDHGLFCKHTNFEQATKVPFIIRPPLRETHWQRGVQSFSPVELLDLMPTLYDLAKLPLDLSPYRKWEGTSLLPILTDPSMGSVKTGAISQYFRGYGTSRITGYSIRTTRFRLTNWGKFQEFYDYLKDPWETKVVVDYATKQTLLQALNTLKKRTVGSFSFDFSQRDAMQAKLPLNYA